MDNRTFDAALRAFDAATTRRRGLAAALGVVGGALLARGGDAAHRDGKSGGKGGRKGDGDRIPDVEGPCGDGSGTANRCRKDADCCTRKCNQSLGRCRCVRRGGDCKTDRNCCSGLACNDGVCAKACGAASCATGCCDRGRCVKATNANRCGTGGAVCTACPPGWTCEAGVCTEVCGPLTCANGCCDNGVCVPGTSVGACGTGGVACVVCSSSAPICNAGTCAAGTWTNPTTFGVEGSGNNDFTSPSGIFVSADGLTAWVVDLDNNRISIWKRPDVTSTAWEYNAQFGTLGSGDTNLDSPRGVFVSADTLTAFVADSDNNRIVIWTRQDASSTTWSYSAKFGTFGGADDNFQTPYGVVVSEDLLTAWIVDMGNDRIAIWTRPDAVSTTWSYLTQFGTFGTGNDNLKGPYGLAVSKDLLTVWVADIGNNRISIWNRPDVASITWSYQTQFGAVGSGDSEFLSPYSVFAADDTLTVWVADEGNNRIVIWSRPDASSTAWAYNAQFGTLGTGAGQFRGPRGAVASADSLTVFVADTNNDRISVWTQS